MKQLAFTILLCFLFTSCGSMTPATMRPLVAAGTSAAIQYAAKPPQRAQVAQEVVAVGNLYDKFSAGHVPNPAQFHLALEQYLPENQSKAITIVGIDALYAGWYPYFADKIPQIQFDYLTNFLLGARDGAQPFVAP